MIADLVAVVPEGMWCAALIAVLWIRTEVGLRRNGRRRSTEDPDGRA